MPRVSRRSPRWSSRAFRALLALYPAAFRDEYGRGLSLVFVDRYRDAGSTWERARLWLDALTGILSCRFRRADLLQQLLSRCDVRRAATKRESSTALAHRWPSC